MPLTAINIAPGLAVDDAPYTSEGRWVSADKARFRSGFPEKIGGWDRYLDDAVSGKARGVHLWATNQGLPCLAVGTHTKLYCATGDELLDITPGALAAGHEYSIGSTGGGWGTSSWGSSPWGTPAPYLENAARIWSFGNWGENLLAAPRFGTLYDWDVNSTAAAAAVTGAPDQIGWMFITPERFAVALGATNTLDSTYDPMLIRWCDQEDYTDWAPSALDLGGDYRASVGSMLMAGAPSKMQNLIWTDQALYGMRYIGDLEFVFGFDLIGSNCGLIAPRAFVERDGMAVWMSAEGQFFLYDGNPPKPLPCPVARYVFDHLVESQVDLIHAGLNSAYNEMWWFYPSDPDTLEVDRYVIFNYAENVWSTGTMERTSWVDGGRLGRPLAIDGDGVVYVHESGTDADGVAMEAYIESAPFDLEDGDRTFHIMRLVPDMIVTGSADVTIKTRRWPQGAVEHAKTRTYTPASTKIDLRAMGRQASVRIGSSAVGDHWRVGKLRFDLVPAGRR